MSKQIINLPNMMFDEKSFEATALAVYLMSKDISQHFVSWQELYDSMIHMSNEHCYKSTYFSMHGYVLTSHNEMGDILICATVSSQLVLNYIVNR